MREAAWKPSVRGVAWIDATPNEAFNIGQISHLIAHLPKPSLIGGNFNARSIAWGDVESNEHGGAIENLLQSSEVCILNTGSPTHVHKQTDTLMCVDLTLTSQDIFIDVEWLVEDDLYGSDHFPCCIAVIVPVAAVDYNNTRFNTDKSNWKLHKLLTHVDFNYKDIHDIDKLLNKFYETIDRAAQRTIPITAGHKYNAIPWCNKACKMTHKQRKYWIRKHRRTRSVQDKIKLNRASAIARKTKRQQENNPGKNMSHRLTVTPLCQRSGKVRKMVGKYNAESLPCLNVNGKEQKKVADALGEQIAHISSTANYDVDFLPNKLRCALRKLNFNTNKYHVYNDPMQDKEIWQALKICKNTAPREDKVQYIIIKNSSESAVEFLIHIFNKVFLGRVYPKA